jgi:hypothetical protein
VGEQVAGEVDRALAADADPQEQGQQFGVGQGGGALGQQALPRTFVGGPVGDCHGVYNSSFCGFG